MTTLPSVAKEVAGTAEGLGNPGLNVSVVICTHNPDAARLSRVLEALRAQSLPCSEWELLVVDNRSREPVELRLVEWHPKGRVVREEEQGLTPARLRGIAETRGDLIVFVDDDNVLRSDYLENASRIGRESPMLGAWGGSQVGEFEETPPTDIVPYLGYIGIRQVERATWANVPKVWAATPSGAGLIVRRPVANRYGAAVAVDTQRRALGRNGQELLANEDIDLAWTSFEIGLGIGVFPDLELLHLIPQGRFERPYLLRLAEGAAYSLALLCWLRLGERPPVVSLPRRTYRDMRDRLGRGFAGEWSRAWRRGTERGRRRIVDLARAPEDH